jgi:phosphate transport system substrate-binding protein
MIIGRPEVADKIYGIVHTSTHDAYINLVTGKADFILVARAPSEDEFKAAAENKVTLDVRAVALDAFVFLAHKDNPISDLSLDRIRDIYTGKITDWAALGGARGPIKPYLRERNSGSQELMESLVMKGAPIIDAPDMLVMGMAGPFNRIRADPAGIGYSVFYYAMNMLPEPEVKLLGINGVKPTSDTIAKYEYPLTAEVYAVVRNSMPKRSSAVMLRDWLFTPEGQAAIGESGYVPLFLPAKAATKEAQK